MVIVCGFGLVINLYHQPCMQITEITDIGRNADAGILRKLGCDITCMDKAVFIGHKISPVLPIGCDTCKGRRGLFCLPVRNGIANTAFKIKIRL